MYSPTPYSVAILGIRLKMNIFRKLFCNTYMSKLLFILKSHLPRLPGSFSKRWIFQWRTCFKFYVPTNNFLGVNFGNDNIILFLMSELNYWTTRCGWEGDPNFFLINMLLWPNKVFIPNFSFLYWLKSYNEWIFIDKF